MLNLPLRTTFLIVAMSCFYGLETRLSFAAGDHPDFFICRINGRSLSIISWHDTNMFPDIMANSHLQHLITGKGKKHCTVSHLMSIRTMMWLLFELMFPSSASFLLGW